MADISTLILRFDRPWATGYSIRVYYRIRPTEPTNSVETDLDVRWLIAECMVRLLRRRRPPDLEFNEWRQLLQMWKDERAIALEEAARRRALPGRRAVTQHWPLV